MKIRLVLFSVILLAVSGSAFAKNHDYTFLAPHVPQPKIGEAIEPDPQQVNTFCAANLSCTISGAWTFTGGVTAGKWNSIITVDGVQFTTCDAAVSAAVTQAGSGLALVIVPSTYAGAACTTIPTSNHVQVWYFNNIDPLVQSGIFFNTTSATPVNAWFRPQVNFTSPTGNSLSVYALSRFTGVIPASSAMDALSAEAQSVGAITSVGAGTKFQAIEAVGTLASTGSTWPDVRVITAYVQDISTNTTNVTNASAIFVPTFLKTGTGTFATVVGALFNRQTIGSTANWSMQSFGTSGFFPGNANEKVIVQGDAFSNSNVLEIVDTHASGHTWDIGEMQAVTHLSFRDISQTGGPAWSMAVTGTTGVEGILSHANTANRTYTFPDATGPVPITPNTLISATAPTIAAGGCGGAAASIVVSNGTGAFKINVGTTPTTACTFTMPAATTGWNCYATDITTNSTSVFLQKQTGVESTTSVTITNFNDVAVATAFVASDILKVACTAD